MTPSRLLFVTIVSTLVVVVAASAYVAWVTWRIQANTLELGRVDLHLNSIDAWIDSRRAVAPADVLAEIQTQHHELWAWLRTHGVDCPPCSPPTP